MYPSSLHTHKHTNRYGMRKRLAYIHMGLSSLSSIPRARNKGNRHWRKGEKRVCVADANPAHAGCTLKKERKGLSSWEKGPRQKRGVEWGWPGGLVAKGNGLYRRVGPLSTHRAVPANSAHANFRGYGSAHKGESSVVGIGLQLGSPRSSGTTRYKVCGGCGCRAPCHCNATRQVLHWGAEVDIAG